MELLTKIKAKALQNHQSQDLTIGIGLDKNQTTVKDSVRDAIAQKFAEVTVYEDPEVMLNDLITGKINGAVRGSLPASKTLQNLRSSFSLEYLLRLACVRIPLIDEYVFLAPVGIDEGGSIDQNLELVIKGHEFIKKLGVEPKIGLVAGGRSEDIDRSVTIKESLEAADKTCELAKAQNIIVDNYGILIEDAVRSCNYIILPDGISGNLIFRTLYYLCGTESIGAPVINIDKVFIDTSRSKKSYVDAIAFASALVD
jgi:putative methanogen marker protein 4